MHRQYPLVKGFQDTEVTPFLAFLERVFQLNDDRPVGFDVEGTPFAKLRDGDSYYFCFQRNVTFSDIAQGYVFLKPLRQLHKVSWADGFVTDSTFEKWTQRGLRHGWLKKGECRTASELNEKVRSVEASEE